MLDHKNAEAITRLREEFGQVVKAYNAAVSAGTVRAIRPAAVAAHQAISALSQTSRTLHPEQVNLPSQVESALADVRSGNLATLKSN